MNYRQIPVERVMRHFDTQWFIKIVRTGIRNDWLNRHWNIRTRINCSVDLILSIRKKTCNRYARTDDCMTQLWLLLPCFLSSLLLFWLYFHSYFHESALVVTLPSLMSSLLLLISLSWLIALSVSDVYYDPYYHHHLH